jgi:hypothetical protein
VCVALEGGHVSCFIRVCCISVCLHSKTSLGPFSLLRADLKIDNKYAAKAAERRASTIPMCPLTATCVLIHSYCCISSALILLCYASKAAEKRASTIPGKKPKWFKMA